MSIRFKFKSVIEFETLDIGRKPYISIGEVRSRIMNVKKLDNVFRKDSDLVLYDAVTGLEYGDDMFQIPTGSSLIVKRVPIEVASSAM
ncbi:DWNN domain-containing protein [Artemisia annua]|uniref:DWNN domain-containing protein n=1 Tax=Artemisia annua TaxID=35608 RepID=A0A2U1NZG2_ARTAN|nr:DWNN domain-containing protein [Artemisia annua]